MLKLTIMKSQLRYLFKNHDLIFSDNGYWRFEKTKISGKELLDNIEIFNSTKGGLSHIIEIHWCPDFVLHKEIDIGSKGGDFIREVLNLNEQFILAKY